MDWYIEKNHEECSDERPWAVVKADDGAVEGCHETREDATSQLRALLQAQAEEREVEVDDAVEDDELVETTASQVVKITLTAAIADDMAANPDMKLVDGAAVTEGIWTGDGRNFAEGSLTWENLDEVIAHFQWQKESSHGGSNDVTVSVGRITKLERVGNSIEVEAFVDTGSEDGAEVVRRLENGTLGGVSIVADDPEQADIELVYPEGCEELQEKTPEELDDVPIEELEACMWPTGVIFHSGRIRALTLVDIPAFVTGAVKLVETSDDNEEQSTDDAGTLLDDNDGPAASVTVKSEEFGVVDTTTPDGERKLSDLNPDAATSVAELLDELEPLLATAHYISIDDTPPVEWFDEPTKLAPFGALTVTDDGRIFGLLAPRDVAHRSFNNKRVTVPMGNVDYSRWMNRETIVSGGERIQTGVITMDCGHASTSASVDAQAGLDHYDNACSAVATARIGENKHGVWIAGALLPGVEPSRVARMLACALSGDWRPSRDKPGMRELVGALLVPVPGFPTEARANLKLDQGQLVASTVPVRRATSTKCADCDDTATTASTDVDADTEIPDDTATDTEAAAAVDEETPIAADVEPLDDNAIPTWEEVQHARALKAQTAEIVAQLQAEYGIEIGV